MAMHTRSKVLSPAKENQDTTHPKHKQAPQEHHQSAIDAADPPEPFDAGAQTRSSRALTPPPRPVTRRRHRPTVNQDVRDLSHFQLDQQQGPGPDNLLQSSQKQQAPWQRKHNTHQQSQPRTGRTASSSIRQERFARDTLQPRTHSRSPTRAFKLSYHQAQVLQPERWRTRRAWEDWIGRLADEAMNDPLPQYSRRQHQYHQHHEQLDHSTLPGIRIEQPEVIVIPDDDEDEDME